MKAHPVVPGSSIYRGGGRNLKRGVGFQFFGCLELLVRIPVAVFYGLLAQRDCRDADRSQPLNALSRPPQTTAARHPHTTYWATLDNGMSLGRWVLLHAEPERSK